MHIGASIADAMFTLAVRSYKDARGNGYEEECDVAVDSFLAHFFKVDKHAFLAIDRQENLLGASDPVEA